MNDVEIRQEISQACAQLRKVRVTHLESRFKNLDELLTEYPDNVLENWPCSETEAIRQDSQSSHSPPP
jgi:hypothetical protein